MPRVTLDLGAEALRCCQQPVPLEMGERMHCPDGLNHQGLKRICQSSMGCRAMLSDLCHVLSMHMLNCLPGCVQGDIDILCPQQHGRGNGSVRKCSGTGAEVCLASLIVTPNA